MRRNREVWMFVAVMIFVLGVAMVGSGRKGMCASKEVRHILVTSKSFMFGQRLPDEYTCQGKNISPHLAWANVPQETKSFAIICDDPDAPAGTWVHWVIFNIPAMILDLAQGMPASETLSNGARQGKNDFGRIGYGGACPPKGHGDHRYFFKVYALDTILDKEPGITKAELEKAMNGHVLADGQLMGTYSRN
jgi:Raf kinase inhibitor-like YbhB/YbcL family protein